jgi:hypothetical protein
VREDVYPSFRGVECSDEKLKIERATEPQQSNESQPKRWDIVGGGGAQGDHDGGGRCHIVSAIELGGKK